MLNTFLRDGVVYGLARVVTSGMSVLLLPLYTRSLSPDQYGVVDFLTVVGSIVCVMVALEIGQGYARYYAEATTDNERIAYASTALLFSAGTFLLFTVLAWTFAWPLAMLLLDDGAAAPLVRVAVLMYWGQNLFTLAQNVLSYQLQARRYAIASFMYSAASLGLAALLLRGLQLGIHGALLAQLLASLVAAALALLFARPRLRFRFDPEKCRRMLAFSLPLVVSSVGAVAALYMDRIAIRSLMPLHALGIYAAGTRLASFVVLAMAGFQLALTPLVYRHYAQENTPREIERIFRWFLALALPFALGIGLFAGEMLGLLTTADYAAAHQAVFLLAIGIVFAHMYMFAPGVWISKRTVWIAIVSLGTAAFNLALNLILIPHFGIIGAAFAGCLAALANFSAYTIAGQRLYPIPFAWRRSVTAIALVLVVGGITLRSGLSVAALGLGPLVLKVAVWGITTGCLLALLIGRAEFVRVLRAAYAALRRRHLERANEALERAGA